MHPPFLIMLKYHPAAHRGASVGMLRGSGGQRSQDWKGWLEDEPGRIQGDKHIFTSEFTVRGLELGD